MTWVTQAMRHCGCNNLAAHEPLLQMPVHLDTARCLVLSVQMCVHCRMKVSLPDPMVLACFETSASSNSHGTSGTQQLRGPTSLLNNPAFAAEAGM